MERTPFRAVFMDLVEIFFRAAGAFYVFAGHVTARTMLMEATADRMIAALANDAEPAGIAGRHVALGAIVVVTAASGTALALMSFWALPLFVAGTAMQTVWLIRASGNPRPRDAEERSGRRRTINAALIYTAVALGVIWLWHDGRLGPAADPLSVGLILATTLYFVVWLRRDLGWRPGPSEMFDDPDLPFEPALRPEKVRLDPCFGSWPLVDVRRGRRFNHLTWLPEELAFRIEDWDDMFQLAFDGDDPAPLPNFGTAERAVAYVEEGRAIVLALCDHFGADNVEVSAAFDRQADSS